MLYDDSRGGSRFEPIEPHDNRQWVPPLADHDLLERFPAPDRVLLLLSGEAADYAFLESQIYEAIGVAWPRSTFEDVIDDLAETGLIRVEEEKDERWLSITAQGLRRAEVLINS